MNTSVYACGYPPDQPATRLQVLIDAVCSAYGVSIGRWDARETWRLDAKPEATEAEIAAARAVMAAFDPWGYGDDLGALSQDDPEDEGQPAASEIFTEEDAEAINDSAVAETGGVEGDGAGDDGVDLREVGDDAPAYPGIAILPDELGARRNAVLAAITTEKLTRLSIAMDPSRADFLAARFAEYQNAGALGLAIDDGLLADRDAFLAMKDRTDRITAYALSLERAAIEADSDMLSAMHAGLGDGWP